MPDRVQVHSVSREDNISSQADHHQNTRESSLQLPVNDEEIGGNETGPGSPHEVPNTSRGREPTYSEAFAGKTQRSTRLRRGGGETEVTKFAAWR